MAGLPVIDRKEIDGLASQWQKAKHVVVMLDDVAKQFACDACNLVLKNFVQQLAEQLAAKKAAAAGEKPAAPAAPAVAKPSLVLTDM